MKTKNTNGFTLVELLVVIAIIGILIAMLLPAVQQVREAARRASCMNNIRQIGLAVMNYESTHEQFPPGWALGDPGDALSEPGWGWSADALPFMDWASVHKQIDFQVAIDDHDHEVVIQSVIPLFLCPSQAGDVQEIVNLDTHVEEHDHDDDDDDHRHGDDDHDDDDDHDHDEPLLVGRSDYSGVFGSFEIADNPLNGDGVFFGGSEIGFRNITDGSSNTMMIGERIQKYGTISWVGMVPEVDEPFARIVGVADHTPNGPEEHFEDFRSYHPGGVVTCLCDGSAHFVRETISEDVFRALATRAGGEVDADITQ